MIPRSLNFIFLVTWSILLQANELSNYNLDGIQLAFTRYNRPPVAQEPSVEATPNNSTPPSSQPTPLPDKSPLKAPDLKPVQSPVIKPVQLQTVNPAQEREVVSGKKAVTNRAPPIEWVVGVGLDVGGGEVGQVTYSDGSTASVNANKGVAFFVGSNFANGKNSSFTTQFTLGYKLGGPRIVSSDVNWSVIPLEVTEFYYAGSIRMGLGLSYQIRPQLSVNVPSLNYTDKYGNSIGLITQIGWSSVKSHYSFDLRYTSIQFQSSGAQGPATVDGSVAGLYVSYRL